MKRISVFVLATLMGWLSRAGNATLVLFVPTNGGLIAAAESRTTLPGELYADGDQKLFTIPKMSIVFTLTGSADWVIAPPAGTDLVKWYPSATFVYKGEDVVRSYIDRHPCVHLSTSYLEKLSVAFVSSLKVFLPEHDDARSRFVGKAMCQVVVGQFNGQTRASTIGSFGVSLNKWGVPAANTLMCQEFAPSADSAEASLSFGETDYLTNVVLNGVGRQFLSPDIRGVLEKMGRVSEVTVSVGAYYAYLLIDAAEKASVVSKPPSGIGGEIHVVLVTGERRRPVRRLVRGVDFGVGTVNGAGPAH